jgi:6-phosphogluconate dehydrogenase
MSGSTIGVYGLGVMGRNLALNLEEHGNSVSLYNRKAKGEKEIVENFLRKDGKDRNFTGAKTVSDFVKSLEKPRKILIMVKAGEPVDSVINELLPHLDEGDILIDGGNSHYEDTGRRIKSLRFNKINFVGMGVSGGEEGARHGPSLMPGGTKKTWNQLRSIFESIAAKSFDGEPCCSFMGSDGAGHFVKMVHNGIEYADMQLIAEAYHIMKSGLGMNEEEISDRFRIWNEGPLGSYLFEITADILIAKDEDGEPLVDKILDSAGQKGTGKWTAFSSLDLGIPLPGITEAVYARFISSLTELRRSSSTQTEDQPDPGDIDREEMLQSLAEAMLASRIMCHAEGFYLITEASEKNRWNVDPAAVAKNWQGGCIIRSELLRTIVSAWEQGSSITHLLQSPLVANRFRKLQSGWRQSIRFAVEQGIPVPVMMASIAHYDALNSDRLPANLIQAQRDYFGAHTYERVDRPRGEFFHTDWKDKKGD